jgi:ligand-binding sensor domain-containing protein/signal transduction histidine kinase
VLLNRVLPAAALCATFTWCWASPAERTLSEYQKRDWHVEDGLPQGNVRTIVQSPGGALLIGTGGGMASFDGLRFTPLKVDDWDEAASEPINTLVYGHNGDLWIGTDGHGVIHRKSSSSDYVSESAGLSKERVRALFEDGTGVMWVATQNGVERIVRDAEGKDRVECLTALGIVPGDVTSPFAPDGAGGMLIVTAKGLFHWTKESVRPLPLRHSELGPVTAAYRDPHDSRDRIWIGTQGGVLSLEKTSGGYSEEVKPAVHGPVALLLADREGNLWVGTRGHGICRISSQGVGHWTSAEGFADDRLRSAFEDNEGNLWFGMLSGGLSRWRQTVMIPFGQPEGLPESYASTVVSNKHGDLWLGTWGQGVFRLRRNGLERVQLPGMPLQSPIRALAEDRGGGMWIGTWYDGLYHSDGNHTSHFLTGAESLSNAVSSLLLDGSGRLLVGTYSGILRYDRGFPEAGQEQVLLPGKMITALNQDPSGRILAGTSQGLYILDGDFVTAVTRKNGLSNDSVISVSIDRRGTAWVGTKAGGLDRIEGNKAVRTPAGGLPAYPIFSVLDDGHGALWMGSTRGVLRVSRDQFYQLSFGGRQTLDVTLFGKSDGMRNSECVGLSQPAAAVAGDGTLWFATAQGFAHTNPLQSQRPLDPPPLRITRIAFDHNEKPAASKVSIPAGIGEVDFEFEAVRLADPTQLRFRYKLENYDADWTETGSRQVVFKHLPPGRYTLAAEVRDHLGPWSPSTTFINVEQLPYLYQRWWFYALLAALLAAMATMIFQWKVAAAHSRVNLVLDERNRIAREWHDTLMANFAAISWQLEATQNRLQSAPGEAASALELSRDMVKHCMTQARRIIWDLRHSDEPAGLLSEELNKALSLMGPRVELGTEVRVEGDERPLPPMCVHHLVCIGQEAVTNALRHGSPRTVRIRVTYEEDRVWMTVQDDGKGFLPASPAHASIGHFGLAVMHERTKKIGGDLTIHSTPGSGTEVLVQVPAPAGAG